MKKPRKPSSDHAPRRGYARGRRTDVQQVLEAMAIDDDASRLARLEELSVKRREAAERVVEDVLRRARERKAEALAAAAPTGRERAAV